MEEQRNSIGNSLLEDHQYCIDIIMKFQLCLTSAKLKLACGGSINITSKLLVSRYPLMIEWSLQGYNCSLGQLEIARLLSRFPDLFPSQCSAAVVL